MSQTSDDLLFASQTEFRQHNNKIISRSNINTHTSLTLTSWSSCTALNPVYAPSLLSVHDCRASANQPKKISATIEQNHICIGDFSSYCITSHRYEISANIERNHTFM